MFSFHQNHIKVGVWWWSLITSRLATIVWLGRQVWLLHFRISKLKAFLVNKLTFFPNETGDKGTTVMLTSISPKCSVQFSANKAVMFRHHSRCKTYVKIFVPCRASINLSSPKELLTSEYLTTISDTCKPVSNKSLIIFCISNPEAIDRLKRNANR